MTPDRIRSQARHPNREPARSAGGRAGARPGRRVQAVLASVMLLVASWMLPWQIGSGRVRAESHAGTKALLYGGVILLLGAGMFRHVLAPTMADGLRRPLRVAASVGAAAIVVLSVANLLLVLHGTLGFLEAGILIDYATSSTHGRATGMRLALTLALVGIALVPRRVWLAWLWAPAAVGLLATFSAISHNASMPGRLPVPADLVHLIAGVGWTSTVLAVAFLPVWSVEHRVALGRAMARVSAVGLAAVALLFATGVYSAQLHVGDPAALVATGLLTTSPMPH